MKTETLRTGSFIAPGLYAAIALLFCGCAQLTKRHSAATSELAEHSRALTSAVVEALHLQPETHRDEFTTLAMSLATEDQRIEGVPAKPLPVAQILVPAETNAVKKAQVRAAANQELGERFARVRTLLERERRTEQKLVALGEAAEIERRRKRAEWWKWGGSTSLGLAGLIAAAFFFPAATPLAGRVLGALVQRMPALAGAAGVVSTDAFDAVVTAIERSKNDAPLANAGQPGASSFLDALRANLAREMDASHKKLVESRRQSLRKRGSI